MSQVLDPAHAVLHEKQLLHLSLCFKPLDVLDVIETQIQGGEVLELFQSVNMRNPVIVEIKLLERFSERRERFDVEDAVLAETELAELGEAMEAEGGDGGDAEVD